MSNAIHILHRPTGNLLCEDGYFRSGIASGMGSQDTLLYRTVGHAMRRLTTKKPGKRIHQDVLKDCVLDVVEVSPGGFKAYRLDQNGRVVDDGPHGGNSSVYVVA
jgi:hypothetical protein